MRKIAKPKPYVIEIVLKLLLRCFDNIIRNMARNKNKEIRSFWGQETEFLPQTQIL